MSKPSTAHIAAAKHLLRYLAGTLNFAITYNQGDLKLMAAFSAVDWGNKPSNGKVDVLLCCLPSERSSEFNMGVQGVTQHNPRWKQSSWPYHGHEGGGALL